MIEQEEFEKFRLDFETKYGIPIDISAWRKIKADEARAKDVQKEAAEFGLPGESTEESNAKCHNCSGGLLYIEHLLYGNRCVFCADQERKVGLLIFLFNCLIDWFIYRQLLRIKALKGAEGRMWLLGCLGAIGYTDINQIKKIGAKIALLKELGGIK